MPVVRPPRSRLRLALAALVVAALADLSGCSQPPTAEERFLDDVRDEYPALSQEDLADEDLVDMAEEACSAAGLSEGSLGNLAIVGVDPERLIELAQPLCPSR